MNSEKARRFIYDLVHSWAWPIHNDCVPYSLGAGYSYPQFVHCTEVINRFIEWAPYDFWEQVDEELIRLDLGTFFSQTYGHRMT